MAPHPKRTPKKKMGQPPPIDQWIKPAIAVGAAMLAYQFYRGMGQEIPRVNVLDDEELREVFFGEGGTGKSYTVLCLSEDSPVPISSVFQEAHADGGSPAEFRLIDCDHVLPASEKSIADRFNLDLKIRPTIFLSGAVHDEPKQIPSKHLKTGTMLTKLLKAKLEPHAAKIETTQDLRSKCLDKDICGVLFKGTKIAPKYLKDAVSKLLKEHPKVTFASMDASVLYMKNVEEHLPELENEQPRFAVFRKVSGSLKKDGDRLITSMAFLQDNGVSYAQMSNLVAQVVSKRATMTKIPALPTVATRTKKLVQEEKAKRQRKKEQQQRQQQKQSQPSSGSGSFTANDGSREGRRLERERRRAEHYAQHNVKPKTPEEIAEMERQRRIRMEEEAAKWNVAPDDAPEEGEPVEDGEYTDDEEGEEEDLDGEDTVDLDAGGEENDEDVIDLD